jgi:hypothetical protein
MGLDENAFRAHGNVVVTPRPDWFEAGGGHTVAAAVARGLGALLTVDPVCR